MTFKTMVNHYFCGLSTNVIYFQLLSGWSPPRLVQLAVVGHVPLSFESAAIFKHQRNGGTAERKGLNHWIGFHGKIYRKPWVFTIKYRVFRLKCSHHPILWLKAQKHARYKWCYPPFQAPFSAQNSPQNSAPGWSHGLLILFLGPSWLWL